MSGRIAYIGREAVLSQEPLFSGYVESDESSDASIIEETQHPMPLEHALKWAREKAGKVVLSYGLTGGDVFSAGTVYHDGGDAADPLPEWPPAAEVISSIDRETEQMLRKQGSSGGKLSVLPPEED